MSQTSRIVVVDYGMGNLWSVSSALRYLGADSTVSGDPRVVEQADTLILPGVGSFRKAMDTLRDSGLAAALTEAVLGRRRKILGICLGMQLLAESGVEDGGAEGLSFMSGRVSRFSEAERAVKVPHIGFNEVRVGPGTVLFKGLLPDSDFYFVHAYRLAAETRPGHSATCSYGGGFLAAYEHENLFATQFHPEKSQTNGLTLLKNFLSA